VNPLRLGFQLGLEHVWSLSRARFGQVCAGLCLLWTVLFSLLSKQAGVTDATTQALLGPVFGIVVPIAVLCYARYLGSSSLGTTATTSALLGVKSRGFALGTSVAAVGCAGMLAAVLAILSVATIRGSTDPRLARDLIASAWIGFLGGAAYASVFVALAAAKHSWWLFGFFLGDWLLGSGSSAWIGLWPRAHLANLLGADVAIPSAFGFSAWCLGGFCALGVGLFAAKA
jgi:hypothetical protein